MERNLLVVSTSTIHGSGYLEYIKEEIASFFLGKKKVLFIPFARPGGISHDDYTKLAKEVFESLNFELKGAHEFDNSEDAVFWADGFFTGGGNTYVLLEQMYETRLLELVKNEIEKGKPYMGTSAGSNITGQTICTTNDMPIIYPRSFDALKLVPFNLNPHYLDPDPNSKHMGETRETRIKEFHAYNSLTVVGLREGSFLRIHGDKIQLLGNLSARIFEQGKDPYEVSTDDDLSFLLNE